MDEFIERHFDYVLGPNQDAQLTTVAAGATITSILRVNSNAPFVMRSYALRRTYTTANKDQAGLNRILARHYDQSRIYLSTDYVRESLRSPYFGQIGNPIALQKEMYFPPLAEIRVDIRNDGASSLSNLTYVFRGVELYRPGAVKSYTYPAKCSPFPHLIPITATSLPVTTPSLLGTRYSFQIKTDADFALQGLQAGFINNSDSSGNPVYEVFITLKDEDEKPYSNWPVPADILCGNSGWPAVFPVGTSARIAPVAGGPNSMGLVYPEIYIPQNHLIYFDVARSDAAYAGAAATDYPIALIGQKVFEK